MSETALIISFLIGLLIVAAGAIVLSVLQIRRIAFEEVLKRRMRRLRGTLQPTVTVLVYARQRGNEVEATLQALRKNRYRNVDIVVVDDASTDETAAVVKAFSARYPKVAIQLLRRRTLTTVSAALQAGYRKSQRGSLVLVVSAGMIVPTSHIKRAVASCRSRAAWRVPLDTRLDAQLDLVTIGHFLKMNYWQGGNASSLYEARYFMQAETHDIMMDDGWALARAIVGSVALVTLLAWAMMSFGFIVLWYVWMLVTAYGLVAVWLRYGQAIRDRLVLTFTLPLALFLIPLTSIMRGISQLPVRK